MPIVAELSLLIFLLVTGTFAFLWFLCLAAWIIGKRKGKASLRRRSGISLCGLSTFGLLCVGGLLWLGRPSAVWQDTFGFAPPEGVSSLQSSSDGFGDWETTYLKFQATPAAMNKIVRHGWQRSSPTDYVGNDKDAPTWWMIHSSRTVQTYKLKVKRKKFSTAEEEILAYDPPTQTAYYFYTGLD